MSYPVSFEQRHKQTQSLKQNQLLMMLPQMQQAITLLQSPILDLSQTINLEIERNPLIEMVEEVAEESLIERHDPEEVSIDHNDFEILKKLDEEYRDFFNQNDIKIRLGKSEEELKTYLDSSVVAPDTLYHHLQVQVQETFESDRDKALAELIIGSLDDGGLLATPLKELAALGQTDEKDMQRILSIIQDFDPPGVGARSVQECLLIQLRKRGKSGTYAERIVQDCYEELLQNKVPAIQKKMKLSASEIRTIIDEEIAKLDLHPGAIFSNIDESYIVPEAEITEEKGKLVVLINEDSIPRLRLNHKYVRMLDQKDLAPETREYIHQHMMSAKWLMKNVYQRNRTLKRLIEFLAEKQKDFLMDPCGELEPMYMLEVAEALDVHESTIARAVASKYVYTPRGLVSLRSMFTFSYKKEDGSEISSHTVREAIERIVQEEDKKKPLSDQKISEKLVEVGIPCARRTISKYRQELNIGNAQQRKLYN